MKEIEIKFDLLNKDKVIDFLTENAEFLKETNQVDIYYDLPHRSFLENTENVHEWLRLRKSDKGCSINYKDWGTNETIMCDEHQEKIENIEEMEKIFSLIDIKEMIRVDKNRKMWSYKGYTICIDTVVDLGDYIELEFLTENDENLAEIEKDLFNLKDELNIETTGQNKKGYPYDLMKNKGLI